MELVHYLGLLAIFTPVWAFSYWILPYFMTYRHLKHIPGPFVAKFSNIWIALGARQGQKFRWVDEAHRKYGKVVRVGFNRRYQCRNCMKCQILIALIQTSPSLRLRACTLFMRTATDS
jgi:hypothetical protein